MLAAAAAEIHDAGFTLACGVFDRRECEEIATELAAALRACADEATALRRSNGVIYGARNVLAIFPAASSLWRRQPVVELLRQILGDDFGLVRGLYFDKPPQGNWSLPWHRDLTIAVADHSRPSPHFCHRTRKAGVPHVEATDEILCRMLTLRIHLDDVTDENGPLQVLAGTHTSRETSGGAEPPVVIRAAAGDVLAMRPLLLHASGPSQPLTKRHRRILHLEFAARRELPDGYQWHEFIRAAE